MTTALAFVVCLLARCFSSTTIAASAADQTSPRSEKEARTPAQQKINSQLLYEIYRRRGEARLKGIPEEPTDVRIDARGRALIDVRFTGSSKPMEAKIRAMGGTILSASTEHRSILTWLSLLKLERLAQDSRVRFIEPAAEATTMRPRRKEGE
jgi:hypothetical protein